MVAHFRNHHKNKNPRILKFIAQGMLALMFVVGALVPFQVAHAAACSLSSITVTRISAPNFYIDNSPSSILLSNYVGYRITNNSGSAIDDLWVQIGNFSGPLIGTALDEDGISHLGPLANGASTLVFFYLSASTTTLGSVETHDVTLYDTRPDLAGGAICESSFTLTTEKSITANANKVLTVIAGPNPAELGGIMTMTVSGETGVMGGAGIFAATPAALADWPANDYELVDVQITMTGGNNGTWDDTLYLTGLNSKATYYTVVYTFVAVGTTTAPTTVSPLNHISSGTQIKHNDDSDWTPLDPILPTENKITLDKAVVPSSFPSGPGPNRVTYTVTISSIGAVDARLDDFVDQLPVGASYVTGSAEYNGSAIDDPHISGSTLTFLGFFTVPAGGSSTLAYEVDLPGADGSYTNTVVGHIGSEQIDRSLDTTDPDPATSTVLVGSNADLTISKSDSADPVNVGDGFSYTVTVTNNGPNAAANVSISDTLPVAYVSFTAGSETLSVAGTCNWVSPTLTCNLTNPIPAGSTVTLTIPGTATAAGTATDTASVTSTTPDPVTPNNTTENTTIVDASTEADLGITKADSPDPVTLKADVTYTLQVHNYGPNTAIAATVTDALSSAFSFVSATVTVGGGTCSHTGEATGGTVTCNLGDIANGATETIEIVATVASYPAGGTLNNTASVSSSTSEPAVDPHLNSDSESTTVTAADLELTKTLTSASPVALGDPVTFTVTVLNNGGPDAANNIVVRDIVPIGINVTSVTATAGTWLSPNWTITSLAPDESATLTITGTTNTVGTITNVAEIIAVDEGDPDSTPNNHILAEDDQDDAQVVVNPSADLELTKTLTTLGPYNLGDTITFVIEVTNNGPSTVSNIVVTDVIPAQIGVTSVVPSVGNWSAPTWDGFGLANGASATLTISGTLDATGTFTNTAEIISVTDVAGAPISDPDSIAGNHDPSEDDQDSETVTTTAAADLSLTKEVITSNPSPPQLGGTIDFRITVSNNGPNDATGVIISDPLPGGVGSLQILSITEGTYNGTNWGTLSIPVGGTDVLEYRVTVTAANTTLTNTAQVSASGQFDPDSTPGNSDPGEDDQSSVSVVISPSADLELDKTVNPATVTVFPSDVTYTVTLTNNGPNSATGVVVDDILPNDPNAVYVSDTGGAATTYNPVTNRLTWNVGTLAPGSTSIDIVVQVTAAGTYANVAEVVAVNEYDPDSRPNNHIPGEDDQDTATVDVLEADLSLTKTVDNPSPNVGDIINFTITVTNASLTTDATDVGVVDKLPPGLNFTGNYSTTNGSTYDEVTGVWDVGTVPADSSVSLTLEVEILPPMGPAGAYVNYTQISSSDLSDPDSTPDDNSNGDDDDATLTVAPAEADLALTKQANVSTVQVGDQIVYTITLINNGPSDATNVTVNEPVPAGTVYVTHTVTGGVYNSGTGDWDIPSLAAGSSVTLQLTVDVAAEGNIFNVAEVMASDQWDPNSIPANGSVTENDRASLVIGPPRPAGVGRGSAETSALDPAISKVGDPLAATVGETVTWTIWVTNTGSIPLAPIFVNDPIPDMFDIISVTTTKGTATISGQVVTVNIGTLDPGETVTIEIETVANADASAGEVCNVAYTGVEASGEACITLFPGELPPTGGGSLAWLAWLGVASVGGLIFGLGGWVLKRRSHFA